MVGLHMLHDDVIERAAAERVRDVLQKQIADGIVDRVEQDALFVRQHIGIVAHAVGNGISALEKGQAAVAAADVSQRIGNGSGTEHGNRPPFEKINLPVYCMRNDA